MTLIILNYELFQFHCAPEDRVYSLYIGLLTTDKLLHIYNTLTRDVFMDRSIWFCGWFAYHVMRLPYFVRRYILVPLIQTFVSSELLPGNLRLMPCPSAWTKYFLSGTK